MSIQALQIQAQNSGAYQIHKKTEALDQVQAEQAVLAVQEAAQQGDEYDKDNPVGTEAEGIYSVTYDEDGSVKVNYTQPSGNVQGAGDSQATSSTDSIEAEIERLKKQRDEIKQQLNKAQDEDTKKALRAQLQMIEAQIAQKTAELKS